MNIINYLKSFILGLSALVSVFFYKKTRDLEDQIEQEKKISDNLQDANEKKNKIIEIEKEMNDKTVQTAKEIVKKEQKINKEKEKVAKDINSAKEGEKLEISL